MRIVWIAHNMKMFLNEVVNGLIFVIYLFTDVASLSAIFKMLGALVFALYFLNQIRWRIIRPHYNGSWKAWAKDWFGLRSKKNGG